MTDRPLRFLAGPSAFRQIRRDGLDPQVITAMVGASGGPKWLGLYHLDRSIVRCFARWYADRRRPLHLIGSSIGAWRFANYARAAPLAAFSDMWDRYSRYEWQPDHDVARVTADTAALLAAVHGPDGVAEMLAHPYLRLHIAAARGRGLVGRPETSALAAGLAMGAAANLAHRRLLGAFVERTLVSDPRDPAPGDWRDFPPQRAALTPANAHDALMATVAIPFLIAGRPVPGAKAGLYRDGGIIDYHFAVPDLAGPGDLVFYPHFCDHVTPGWFDKMLRHRRAGARILDRTLIVCPSPAFLARLPGAKIPDRQDFKHHETAERQRLWAQSVAETERLAEDFEGVVEAGTLADRLEPLA